MTSTLTDQPPPAASPPRIRLLSEQPDLGSHLARLGRTPLHGPRLLGLVDGAGLTGKGGAGFPTARKLDAVAARGGWPVVVANGTEGEPLSLKDKLLLLRSPHLVLDGLDEVAAALGAARRVVAIEDGRADVERAVRRALSERGDHEVEVVRCPRRYLSGQETALVDLINGGAGRPSQRRPFEEGVSGQPTLVDNVETLAHLALIARFGPAWYRGTGTADEPGRTLVTLAGAVDHPGVVEAPLGLPLARLLARARARHVRAVLVGGYYGQWISGRAAEQLTFDRRSLGSVGASVGAGVVAVLDDDSCAVAELARVADWYAASSAGQCGACTWGLRDLATATAAVAGGTPDPVAVADIERWTAMVRGRGACGLPDGAANFLASGIGVFRREIAEHRLGHCTRPDRHLLPVPAPEPWR